MQLSDGFNMFLDYRRGVLSADHQEAMYMPCNDIQDAIQEFTAPDLDLESYLLTLEMEK